MSHMCEEITQSAEQCKKSLAQEKTYCISRRKREFVPDELKDAHYWEKRRRNNLAAKRSREKKRQQDFAIENKVLALNLENSTLKAELLSIKSQYGLMNPSDSSKCVHDNQKSQSQLKGIDLPFPNLKSITYTSQTPAMHKVISRGSGKDLRDLATLAVDLSRKEIMNDFENCNQLPKATTTSSSSLSSALNYDLCGTSLLNVHFNACLPGLLDHNNNYRFNQEIPVVSYFSLPFYSAMETEQKLSALPHKLRIKTKTVGAFSFN
ncbi:nuclear factor interleukin-3-regulated protein-like [Lithobates pipiens]